MSIVANQGDKVEILYTGKLKDQTIFDTTADRGPFQFVIGSQGIIKGVSEAVLGMKVGDKKLVELSPQDAYGYYNDQLVSKIPKTNIPANAKIGDILTDPNGRNWWVRQFENDSVLIDGNHPLAGQSLIFEIELVKIN